MVFCGYSNCYQYSKFGIPKTTQLSRIQNTQFQNYVYYKLLLNRESEPQCVLFCSTMLHFPPKTQQASGRT